MTAENPVFGADMIFSSTRMRQALAIVAVIAGLAACGGGTSQQEAFAPQRLLVFGDETSVITAGGLKYSINGLAILTDGTLVADCTAMPNWVQSLAGVYGFVFAECNPNNVETPQARMLALEGAKVADIKIQLDAQIANGGFRDKDLATMLAGANDILDLYSQFPGRTEGDLTNEARARGKALAEQVNRLVDYGAKVILATVPDMGLTPFAIKQRVEFGDTDRAALLSRLTAAFNEQLGVNILLDGRYIGLVQADLRTQAMVRSPASFGIANVTTAACAETAILPACDATTLVDGANPTTWMWADDLRLAFTAQQQIAALAIDRARRNPF
jgi:outer membrane lipase/esterase